MLNARRERTNEVRSDEWWHRSPFEFSSNKWIIKCNIECGIKIDKLNRCLFIDCHSIVTFAQHTKRLKSFFRAYKSCKHYCRVCHLSHALCTFRYIVIAWYMNAIHAVTATILSIVKFIGDGAWNPIPIWIVIARLFYVIHHKMDSVFGVACLFNFSCSKR